MHVDHLNDICSLRVALLLLATSAFLGTWVVEQPKSSLLFELSPLQFVCERMQAGAPSLLIQSIFLSYIYIYYVYIYIMYIYI